MSLNKSAGKVFLLVLAAITVSNLGATLYSQAQKTPEQENPKDKEQRQALKSKFPVADFESSQPGDPEKRAKRKARSQRHDDSMLGVKGGLNPAPDVGDEVVVINDWEVRVPIIPASLSDVVLVGEVLDANAFTSEDQNGVYSEFSLKVGEVIKNTTDSAISAGEIVTAERQGGQVRYPSGRTMWFHIQLQSLPTVNNRYVFFLKQAGGDSLSIITGYELRAGRVYPLDDGASQFKKHEGADEISFLKLVRKAITK